MDQLLKVSPCSDDYPPSLRYMYDQMCVHYHSLASLGVTSDQYGSLLIPIIMSKLLSKIRLQIAAMLLRILLNKETFWNEINDVLIAYDLVTK